MSSLKEIKEDLELLEERKDKLEYIISLGKTLKPFPSKLMTKENLVPSCNSPTFITKKPLLGHSESLIVKGYIAIILKAFEEEKKEELDQKIKQFVKDTKLNVSMVSTRANAFMNMYEYLKQK
ncbi:MAG: SufE family protein [Candidatus Woesearchaeota archaeon]